MLMLGRPAGWEKRNPSRKSPRVDARPVPRRREPPDRTIPETCKCAVIGSNIEPLCVAKEVPKSKTEGKGNTRERRQKQPSTEMPESAPEAEPHR